MLNNYNEDKQDLTQTEVEVEGGRRWKETNEKNRSM